ncbi:hypothetical protein GPL17_22340 [Bradyrhizobium yuanmingense]|nr:hypothetical protein [Bradyrhizobium yuanmingense]
MAGLVCMDRCQHAIAAPAGVFGKRLAHQYVAIYHQDGRLRQRMPSLHRCCDQPRNAAIRLWDEPAELAGGDCFVLVPAANKDRHRWVFGANKLGKSDRRALSTLISDECPQAAARQASVSAEMSKQVRDMN